MSNNSARAYELEQLRLASDSTAIIEYRNEFWNGSMFPCRSWTVDTIEEAESIYQDLMAEGADASELRKYAIVPF